MDEKEKLATELREVFNGWEDLLASLSEERITKRNLPADLSVQDILGHLRAWQQVSIARLEAALGGREPVYPAWTEGQDIDAEENLEPCNARIHEEYLTQPWPQVYGAWREGFLRFLELAEAVPERSLFEMGTYSWLRDYPLSLVLEGSLDHHREHLDEVRAWFTSG